MTSSSLGYWAILKVPDDATDAAGGATADGGDMRCAEIVGSVGGAHSGCVGSGDSGGDVMADEGGGAVSGSGIEADAAGYEVRFLVDDDAAEAATTAEAVALAYDGRARVHILIEDVVGIAAHDHVAVNPQ